MKDYSRETIIDIIDDGDENVMTAFRLGNHINTIMADEEAFEEACTSDEPLITITIGKCKDIPSRTFRLYWAAGVINPLDDFLEAIIEEKY